MLRKSYCWAGRSYQQLPGSLPAAASRLLAGRLSSCFCCICPLPALNPFLPFHQDNASDFESHFVLCPCLPLWKSNPVSVYSPSPSNSSTSPAACHLPRSHDLYLPSSGLSFAPQLLSLAPAPPRSLTQSKQMHTWNDWISFLLLHSGPVSASPAPC